VHRSGYRFNAEHNGQSFRELEEFIVQIADDVHPPFDYIVAWFEDRLEKQTV